MKELGDPEMTQLRCYVLYNMCVCVYMRAGMHMCMHACCGCVHMYVCVCVQVYVGVNVCM